MCSTEAERNTIKRQKRKEYKKLRRKCQQLLRMDGYELPKVTGSKKGGILFFNEDSESSDSEDPSTARQSLSIEEANADNADTKQQVLTSNIDGNNPKNISSDEHVPQSINKEGLNTDDLNSKEEDHDTASHSNSCLVEDEDRSGITHVDASEANTESSDTTSSVDESESMQMSNLTEKSDDSSRRAKVDSLKGDSSESLKFQRTVEDYATWQRIFNSSCSFLGQGMPVCRNCRLERL